MGTANPSELAAMGFCLLPAAQLGGDKENYRRYSLRYVMLVMILTAATAFSQILAYTEASKGLSEFVIGLYLPL